MEKGKTERTLGTRGPSPGPPIGEISDGGNRGSLSILGEVRGFTVEIKLA